MCYKHGSTIRRKHRFKANNRCSTSHYGSSMELAQNKRCNSAAIPDKSFQLHPQAFDELASRGPLDTVIVVTEIA